MQTRDKVAATILNLKSRYKSLLVFLGMYIKGVNVKNVTFFKRVLLSFLFT